MTKYLNPNKLRELIKFYPHTGQQEVLLKQKRFTILCCGNRWGKSILAAWIALKEAFLPEKLIWICAPTYDLGRRVWDYIVLWLNKYLPQANAKINNSTLEITIGSSKICVKSAQAGNEASLLGSGVNLIVADEFSRISKGVWEEYLRPRLVDKQGRGVFISTPIGKQNHFHDLYLRGLNQDDPEYISFNFPTSTNPFISSKELEGVKESVSSDLWRQNFLGEFLDTNATVFKGLENIIKEGIEMNPVPGVSYIAGIDLCAKGKGGDWTAITIIDRISKNVVFLDRFRGEDFSYQKEKISMITKKYNNCLTIIDSTGFQSAIAESLRECGVNIQDFVFSNKTKNALIEKLRIYIEMGHIKIPRNEILISELENFGCILTDKGNVTYQAPEGQHDDAVISLSLGVWGLDYREPVAKRDYLAEHLAAHWATNWRKQKGQDNRI